MHAGCPATARAHTLHPLHTGRRKKSAPQGHFGSGERLVYRIAGTASGGSPHLGLEVIGQAHHANQAQLFFQPVGMVFLGIFELCQ